eukprot:CAMPEP_0206476444 /NCGR_PEP_ID=MMETSP0324_2-20121206/34730_1 /ASSEMBLY_ACC=CAM_ASM_000836 /TAXON_ID=2866 /ORGANISM="Crypthecodinium cohnii, Strain Seligo" /LENGTH=710 /DNA_ID=CAMNT_0053952097 /DNA_START=295 /DNA_END=2424 /DNA_ORIENTATION=-
MSDGTATGEGAASGPRICEEGGGGLFLPLGGETERQWDVRLKLLLYFVGLVYSFLGVSIVADIFMAAIERITSLQKKVKVPGTNRMVTVQVWNETVANLTLMALGSSAPEILLALNDVLKNRFFEGSLGPSTIVGSAAFNLFCIIAVCINSIPNGEVRMIKEVHVFAVTAAWSIFAYLWLLFIVQFNSKDIIELWEGVLTFLFFPLLVAHSWATDAGLLTGENVKAFVMSNYIWFVTLGEETEADFSWLGFLAGIVLLIPRLVWVIVKYSALGSVLCFQALMRRCCCRPARTYKLSDDLADLEDATADLEQEIVDEDNNVIEHEAGIMSFAFDVLNISIGTEEESFNVKVYRRNGDRGRVTVRYSMIGLTAVPGYDFVDEEGELHFRDGVLEQDLEFTVLPKRVGERSDSFQIIIEDETETVMFNPWHDGGEEKNILTVSVANKNPRPVSVMDKAYTALDGVFNVDEFKLGFACWKDQVAEAFYCGGSLEEQEAAGVGAWIAHLIWIPWKLPFAVFVPPPVFMGGWVCFVFSLMGIGILTIVIGDLAELFGCVMNIDDGITAISIVAMGTSVPDMFASRTAAKADEYADASIVNVTGSNSVNVFLGIGLPWMWAALYWAITGANSEWTARYGHRFPDTWGANGSAAFVVQSGQLFFSVCVFTLAALVCLTVITFRRVRYGGELGGPSDAKAYSSFLLVLLWFFYIGLSVW